MLSEWALKLGKEAHSTDADYIERHAFYAEKLE